MQNLPQNHLPDIEQARALVRSGNFAALELLYDSVPEVLSELIRTAFIPKDGNKLIIADFSAIEARVIAWFAGEVWRNEVFAGHGRIYEASASQMFNIPIEEITKGSPLRQKGKIAELALGYGGSVGALKAILEHFHSVKGRMPNYVVGGFHLSSRSGGNEDADTIDRIGQYLMGTKA